MEIKLILKYDIYSFIIIYHYYILSFISVKLKYEIHKKKLVLIKNVNVIKFI